MRYFEFTLLTNADEIKENAKIKLNEFYYGSAIGSVNEFMYRTMKNGCTFLAYREENENSILAAFSYDERKYNFRDAYKYILDKLYDAFEIKRVKVEPCEITMFQFYEHLQEAQRRDLTSNNRRLLESANVFIADYIFDKPKFFRYDFEEIVVSETVEKDDSMYDKDFKNELLNIEKHKNGSDFNGNMVHYILSCRSSEAAKEMVESLVANLFKANRIKSRRIEIINNIEPDLYKQSNRLEEIIENNYGGTIVIDLTEKFGFDPVDYRLVCKFLEKLVKKYRSNCLFIFTYNIDHPGFSYFLLPELKRYILPIALKEGSGNREAAIKYAESLIKNSEYSKYSNQANEFLEQFPENEFTHTDVLMAYEKFDAWCLNKNILNAYEYNLSDEFLLDRDSDCNSNYEKLQTMIGLEQVKKQIDDIIATNILEKERKKRKGRGYTSGSMHMVFAGNPGTAKTTVAKLFAGIAKEKGVLKSGAFVERGGMDLDGLCCDIAIRDAFAAAKGGVLFIDEAYSMKSQTAVTVLLQEMENRREEVIVVLAGYDERMNAFMELNEGLKSRIPYWVDFPDYNTDELTDIFKLMLREKGLIATDDALQEAHYIFEKARYIENFGNGRYVRNLIENAIQKQSVRLLESTSETDSINNKELFLLTKEDIRVLDEGLQEERMIGTAQKELEEMIGLENVKAIIKKAKAYFKLKKLSMEKGGCKNNASFHMVFTGNPGTAKTTVARLFAEILKDEKVLPTGKFVEVGRSELVGEHVGSTAPLVKKRFKEANGGVLFIDEAYSLCDSCENSFGDEAITTIVQEMENNRDSVIVIFAGYPLQMKQFLSRNPGLSSRIAFHVNFEDYTVEDLIGITKLMISKKQMSITEDGMNKLRKHYESVNGSNDFGNGRFVRKLLEEAEMNLAERLLQFDESEITEKLLTSIEECDIPEVKHAKTEKKYPIGFCG